MKRIMLVFVTLTLCSCNVAHVAEKDLTKGKEMCDNNDGVHQWVFNDNTIIATCTNGVKFTYREEGK
ncbi:MAG: hypothetical protein KAS32_27195 [Candidatus Peribacteraceae bacterium]|nr:hypothetical protein [Candidatus Peribacteraceae bacterium]